MREYLSPVLLLLLLLLLTNNAGIVGKLSKINVRVSRSSDPANSSQRNIVVTLTPLLLGGQRGKPPRVLGVYLLVAELLLLISAPYSNHFVVCIVVNDSAAT